MNNSNEKIESEVTLMSEKVSAFTKTHLVYALCECNECGHRWGINPDDKGIADISMFLCKKCFAREMLKNQ